MTENRDITRSSVEELLDFATVYGEWDETTPNGTISRLCSEPMSDRRRGAIWALKNVLGMPVVPWGVTQIQKFHQRDS